MILVAHSAGGLLVRRDLASPERAAKVARSLTLGVPWRGATRAVLPLRFGLTDEDTLDGIIRSGRLQGAVQSFARNQPGLYALVPSAAYGPWLAMGNRAPARTSAAASGLARLAPINPRLLRAALAAQRRAADVPDTNGVPVEAIIGRGLPTPVQLSMRRRGRGTDRILLADGDGTVPAASASLGTAGGGSTAAHRIGTVHVDERCEVSHKNLTNGTVLDDAAVRAFLRAGTQVAWNAKACATPAGSKPIEP